MPDRILIADINIRLYREFLPDDRPLINECSWIESIPAGPSEQGRRRLVQIQEHYGACHVTTAAGTYSGWTGVYVRGDVLEKTENPLRTYLSRAK